MAVQQKASDAGWFYHAPAKPKNAAAVDVPPASQIPGLSDLGPEPPQEEPMRGYIKESDSKYIRLAKMGGRQDLLKMKDFKAKSEDPVGYPRVEWYYLEDNAAEDAETKKEVDWEFKLPDYMVHQERKTGKNDSKDDQYDPKRLPYGWDKKTAYEREKCRATDKTVRIEEARRPGFGVRNEKANKRDQKKIQPSTEQRVKSGGSTQSQHFDLPNYPPQGQQHRIVEDRPNMSKLMSFGYAYDAQKEREEQKRLAMEAQFDALSAQEQNNNSQVQFESDKKQECKDKKNMKSKQTKVQKKEPAEEKEPFKLSKFKNVSARTQTHRK